MSEQTAEVVKIAEPIKSPSKMEILKDKFQKAPLSAKIIGALALAWAAPKIYEKGKSVAGFSQEEQKVYSTAEAQGQVGKTVTVEFVVGSSKYIEYSKRALINEGQFPNHSFTVTSVGGSGVPAKGTKVRATGVVTMRNGKPQLECKPEDIK